MSGARKRQLGELVFYYRRNAERHGTKDLFVEGGGDKLLMDRYFSVRSVSEKFSRVAVYSMDSIDFSGTDFSAFELPAPSARSCVIALRKILSDSGASLKNLAFLIDRDIEDVRPTPHVKDILLTDSGALPVHLFDNNAEERICGLILDGRIDVSVFKRSVNSICRGVYTVRAASMVKQAPAKILSPKGFIRGNVAAGYDLDVRGYLERCLYAGNCHERYDEIYEAVGDVDSRLDALELRPFSFINDHDLYVTLKEIFDLAGDRANRSAKDIEGLILMTYDHSELERHSLFEGLDRWLSVSPSA